MKDIKFEFYRVLFYLKEKINIIFFLLSVFSILCVFLNLLGFSLIIFQPITLLSTIFILLFLPSYPIFYIILKNKDLNFLEKLSLTIVLNAVFYILSGYIGNFLGIPITGFFFFILLITCYLLIILYIIYREVKAGTIGFFKSEKSLDEYNRNVREFSLYRYIKNRIPLSGLLLIIFLFLICILNVVRVSYFAGTDPWKHIFNSKIITEFNFLPLENYEGGMGLNIIEAVITFFSGVDHILIPRYFLFYTIFLSGLICYNISMRIFKNQNLTLFGIFILEFSSLGFSIMMIQYWPSGLTLIMCLMVFFLLYIRIQNLIQLERPEKSTIFKDIYFTYTLVALIFISAFLTHVITATIFLFSFIWLYFIYFLKDRTRGIDFFLVVGLFGFLLILNYLGIGRDYVGHFIPINISWYFIIAIGIAGILAGAFLFWKIQKSINFTKGRYKSTITGKTNPIYKRIEDKVIIPLIFSIIILLTIVMLIVNIIWFNFETINVLNISEIILFSAFAFWGLIIFQKKPKGKVLFIWGAFFIILLGVGFILNIFLIKIMVWERILYLIPPIIVIGFISYIYKLIKLNSIQFLHIKLVILLVITFSLFTTYFNEFVSIEIFNMKHREVSTLQWYSNNTSNENIIFSEFGWGYVIDYYDYPFYDKDEALLYNGSIYILPSKIDLFPPKNHINESGINLLRYFKEKYNSDVYLIFENDYVIDKGFNLFGHLTPEETEEYYTLNYLNKICSSKTENGIEVPLFWVI